MTIASTLGESVTFSNPSQVLVINGGTGDDTITINSVDGDGPFNVGLTINGNDGNDSVSLDGEITLGGDHELSVTATTIQTQAPIATTGGDISLVATEDITLFNRLRTQSGAVTLHADSNGDGSGSLSLSEAASGSWTEQQKFFPNDLADDDRFGMAVAIDGNTAIVGADRSDSSAFEAGAAYVFTKSENAWIQQAKLVADNASIRDHFGGSVAIDGDTAVVGSLGAGVGGSVYVFSRAGGTWTQQAELTLDNPAAADSFGVSVSISGDTILVGANQTDESGNSSGSAYIFVRSETTWVYQAKLTADDAATGDNFGAAVAISGDTAIVGSTYADAAGDSSGAAYVYTRNGTNWIQQAKLTGSDAAAYDRIGSSVAASGDTLVVGAHGDDEHFRNSGAVYVYTRDENAWAEQSKLTASDPAASDAFGYSVGISGENLIVGAMGDDDFGSFTGSAYTFTRAGSVWSPEAKLLAHDATALDQFGSSVAISGTTRLVGAPSWHNARSTPGSAFLLTNATGSVATAGGRIEIKAADVDILGTIDATPEGKLNITTSLSGRPIDLGSDTPGVLGLTDAELDRVLAGTIAIGSVASGVIAVTADVTRPDATDLRLVSGGDIGISGGQIDTAGGTLLLDSGASPAAVKPTHSGFDASVSTLSIGGDLSITINGPAVDSQYTQLRVAGQIDLTGVDLAFSGAFSPAAAHSFTIVENDGTEPIIGTFNSLPEGALLPDFLGSGLTFAISYVGGTGNDVVLSAPVASQVVDRKVFYNRSEFDGNNPAADASDDSAIASTKVALLPGGTATAANFTNYVYGINGVMVDLHNATAPASLTSASFVFRTGDDMNLDNWSSGPVPTSVTVRDIGDSVSRLTLIWPDGSIVGKWLEVTVKANEYTGLSEDDVFYFGNQIGDTNGDGLTNSTDFALIRVNPSNFLTPADVTNPYDINRDGRVNAIDLVVVREHATPLGEGLPMIEPFATSGLNVLPPETKQQPTAADQENAPNAMSASTENPNHAVHFAALLAVIEEGDRVDPISSISHEEVENDLIESLLRGTFL